MIKYLLLIFLLSIAKITPAQVSSLVMATATIVNPVGTEEITDSDASQESYSGNSYNPLFADAVLLPSGKKGLTKFRVINESLVYAITVIPYTTEKLALQKKAEKHLAGIQLRPMTGGDSEDLFTLQSIAKIPQGFSAGDEQKSLPDVVIHFN